ncbi:MAG TPA: potassium transporter TrkG [Burkholderiales bacterium]
MLRLSTILNLLSVVVLLFAVAMVVPLGVSLLVRDGAEDAYDLAIVLTALAGGIIWLLTRRGRQDLRPRDGFIFVVLVWTVLPAFAALPLLAHLPELSLTDAYFEAMSGLTATGATVLSGLDALPPSINLWRCMLQWLGGMGVIVLVVAVLPLLGVGGRQLLKAETPGPMKDHQLTPRIASTAKGLWLVYVLLTVLCALAYVWAGMSTLDAVMHAFTTISLGGFSSHDLSLGFWASPAIEACAIVFMVVAGVNFGTHFLALRRRSLRSYASDTEARAFVAVLLASVALHAGYLTLQGVYADPGVALRYAAFNVVSVATTTGYSTTDYAAWPVFVSLWMLMLCTFCTCSGSAGGGIKMMRALLMLQQASRELARIVHPRALIPVKLGGQVVENNVIFAVLAYMLVYGATLTALTMLLTATGLDFLTSFSAAAASLNNLGPGLGEVGPATTYALLSDFQKWICTLAMLLGRLELLTVFVLLSPAFWRR